MAGQLDYSFMDTACTTTMHDPTCQVLCRHHSSLGTWPAFAMVSSSCSEWWAFGLPSYLFATFIDPSSASSHSAPNLISLTQGGGGPCSQEAGAEPFWVLGIVVTPARELSLCLSVCDHRYL